MEDACIEWSGYVRPNGYGRMTIGRKQLYPHRVVYRLFYGAIPKDKEVCHHCDNRKCINPKHLFAGTRSDNMIDALKKGRLSRGPGHGALICGERAGNAKLTERDVLLIRDLAAEGKMMQKDIAKRFGVGPDNIRSITQRKSWRHI